MSACAWREAVPSTRGGKMGFFMCEPSDNAPAHLVELDRLEQRLEIAFAEALVALALDDLEKDRPDDILREDLQQQPFALRRVAVDEHAALLQLVEIFLVAGDARIDAFIVSIGRVLELHTLAAQHVDRAQDVRGAERDVLDALAVVLAQILFDLRLVVLRFVDRDADLAAGAGHGAAEQPGLLAFDVEVADLAEVEQLLVEAGPLVHVAARDVVSEMIDVREPRGTAARSAGHRHEVDVVNRALAVAVDQIDQAAADAFDRRNVQLHRPDARLHRLRAQLDTATQRERRILHAERHRARRRTMRTRE